MSYFKKFTDFIGGIACFIAAIFLVGKYMSFTPPEPDVLDEVVEVRSKFDLFFNVESGKDYRQYVILIAVLFLSVAVGRIFKKIPAVSFCVAILPVWQVMNMINNKLLYEYVGLFVVLTVVHLVGACYELVYRDSQDNKKRTFVATAALGVIASGACLLAKKVSAFAKVFYERFLDGELAKEDMAFEKKLALVGLDVLGDIPEEEEKIIMTIFVLLLISVIVSIILRGVYFVDVVLAALPFVYSIYVWHAQKLLSAPMLVLVPVIVYFFARVALFVTGVGVRTREDKNKIAGAKGEI